MTWSCVCEFLWVSEIIAGKSDVSGVCVWCSPCGCNNSSGLPFTLGESLWWGNVPRCWPVPRISLVLFLTVEECSSSPLSLPWCHALTDLMTLRGHQMPVEVMHDPESLPITIRVPCDCMKSWWCLPVRASWWPLSYQWSHGWLIIHFNERLIVFPAAQSQYITIVSPWSISINRGGRGVRVRTYKW